MQNPNQKKQNQKNLKPKQYELAKIAPKEFELKKILPREFEESIAERIKTRRQKSDIKSKKARIKNVNSRSNVQQITNFFGIIKSRE